MSLVLSAFKMNCPVSAIVILVFWGGAFASAQTCFDKNSNKRLEFQVIENAPPPLPNEKSYPYYPFTAIASMSLERINAEASRAEVPLYYWQWSNHGPRRVNKGNVSPGVPHVQSTVVDFSTPGKADACTLAQTAVAIGDPERAKKFASSAGLTLTTQAPGPGSTINVCILPAEALDPRVKGIVLDYEVQDGRLPKQTTDFLRTWTTLVRGAGKQSIFYPNALNAASQRLTGITPDNAKLIAQEFDYASILLWGGNWEHDIKASYQDQMRLLGPGVPHNKLLVTFELNMTSTKDAKTVRQLLLADHLAGIMLWRNNAKQGGTCDTEVNRKLACIAFGDCSK